MKNHNFDEKELLEDDFESNQRNIMDYIGIIRNNILPIILIFIISLTLGMLLPVIAEKVFDRYNLTRVIFLGRSLRDSNIKQSVPDMS